MLYSEIKSVLNDLNKDQLLQYGNEVLQTNIPDVEGKNWLKHEGVDLLAFFLYKRQGHIQTMTDHVFFFVKLEKDIHPKNVPSLFSRPAFADSFTALFLMACSFAIIGYPLLTRIWEVSK